MEIEKGIEIIGKSLYLKKDKTLIISDLHLGYEKTMEDSGLFFPKTMFEIIKKELNEIMKKRKIDRIIVLGDLKHEFKGINKQEGAETKKLLEILKEKTGKVILIRGNHDNILKPIAKNFGLEIKDYYIENEIAFFHGHKILNELYDKKIKMWITGHIHPAITIKKGIKGEKYKCFLVGKFKDKKIIIMPSFFPLVEGSDVLKNQAISFFKINKNNFGVYVVDDNNRNYYFKKIKDLKKLK